MNEPTSLRSIYYRDQGICWYCGMLAPRSTHISLLRATRDHIIPLSHNGPTTVDNLRLAHAYCNTARMGLYQRPKEIITARITSLLTPRQIQVAIQDIEINRKSIEKLRHSRLRDEEFKRQREMKNASGST